MGARVYDLSGVEETRFINEVGEHLLKVVSVSQDKTSNGNDVEKVTFVNAEGEQISDEFVITPKALWKLKLFVKALKLPDVSSTDHWINRGVVATVRTEKYQKENGEKGEKLVISKYAPYVKPEAEQKQDIPVEVKDADGSLLEQGTLQDYGKQDDEPPFEDDEVAF